MIYGKPPLKYVCIYIYTYGYIYIYIIYMILYNAINPGELLGDGFKEDMITIRRNCTPGKQTAGPQPGWVSNRNLLFEGSIFRCHVNFLGVYTVTSWWL